MEMVKQFPFHEIKCSHVVYVINLFLGLFWYHRRLGHAVNAIAMEFLNRTAQYYWDMIGFAGYHFFEEKKK